LVHNDDDTCAVEIGCVVRAPLAGAHGVTGRYSADGLDGEHVLLALDDVDGFVFDHAGDELRYVERHAANALHVPDPSAVPIRATLAEVFREVTNDLEQERSVVVVVVVRRSDAALDIGFGEQVGHRQAERLHYRFRFAARLALDKRAPVLAFLHTEGGGSVLVRRALPIAPTMNRPPLLEGGDDGRVAA